VKVPYFARDAAYSASLDRVVIVTDEPALRVVNPHESYSAVKPALDVGRDRMYVLGLSQNGITEYSTPAGSLTYFRSSASSKYQGSGPWLAPDGTRIYGGTGDVWSPASLTTTASLHVEAGDTATFDCVSDSTVAGKILASRGGWGDDAFRVYDRALTSAPVRKHAPAFFSGTSATGGGVYWVFWKRDGSGYYALSQGGGFLGIAEY
jgi:hypothetical protein